MSLNINQVLPANQTLDIQEQEREPFTLLLSRLAEVSRSAEVIIRGLT